MKNYFKPSEFQCKCGCGAKEMSEKLLDKLNEARDIARIPFVINSGKRCNVHNSHVGGVKNSAHTFGYAVDIRATSSMARYRILTALIKVGFTRIGIYKTFIHVDVDPSKPTGVVWYG